MKLAYSSNAYRTCSVLDAVDRIAAIRYQAMELMADEPHAWPLTTSKEDRAAIRSRMKDRGLTLSNVNAFMTSAIRDFWHPSWIEPDPSFRRLRVQHTIAALTLAADLGAPSITTEPGGPLDPGMSRDHAMDIFVDGLSEALRHAEELGVLLLVEPEPDLLIENAQQFLALAERMTSPMFGLNFDIGHFYCVGEDPASLILREDVRPMHFHLEDIAADRVHHHLPPGEGAMDF
ncbi:MAG: sugar phosphate isomerase/epimerase, partial [Planctomycetes bacterium]|nr:sugar phosphate isomerase/epimerase [Planctomycetota bacterium]